jgi:hypothetical protein
MESLATGEGFHEEVNNGTAVPLKKVPYRAFSSHPFHGWLLTSHKSRQNKLEYLRYLLYANSSVF